MEERKESRQFENKLEALERREFSDKNYNYCSISLAYFTATKFNKVT